MARSFIKLYSLDLGFETSHLLTLRTQLVESKYPKPEQRQIFFDALQARVRALPGVTNAALVSSFPLSGAGEFKFEIRRQAGRSECRTTTNHGDRCRTGLFRNAGRFAGPRPNVHRRRRRRGIRGHRHQPEAGQRYFANGDPLGRRIRIFEGPKEDKAGKWMTVVGVSPTIGKAKSRHSSPPPCSIVRCGWSSRLGAGMIVRTAANPADHGDRRARGGETAGSGPAVVRGAGLRRRRRRNAMAVSRLRHAVRHLCRYCAGAVVGRPLRDYSRTRFRSAHRSSACVSPSARRRRRFPG